MAVEAHAEDIKIENFLSPWMLWISRGAYIQSYVNFPQSVNDGGYGNRGKAEKRKNPRSACVRALTFILLAEKTGQRVSAAESQIYTTYYFATALNVRCLFYICVRGC